MSLIPVLVKSNQELHERIVDQDAQIADLDGANDAKQRRSDEVEERLNALTLWLREWRPKSDIYCTNDETIAGRFNFRDETSKFRPHTSTTMTYNAFSETDTTSDRRPRPNKWERTHGIPTFNSTSKLARQEMRWASKAAQLVILVTMVRFVTLRTSTVSATCNCPDPQAKHHVLSSGDLLHLLKVTSEKLPYDMEFGLRRHERATAIGRAFLDVFSSEVEKHAVPNGTCLEFTPVYLADSNLQGLCKTTWELAYSSDMCDKGKYKGANGYCMDVHTLDHVAQPDQFDLVICTQVFEHLTRPWVAARQLARVLRPGGILMFSAPHTSIYHAHFDDYYRFTVAGARYMLENIAGLCVLYEAGGNSIFFTVLSLLGYAMDDINVTHMLETADPIAPLNVYLIAKKTKTQEECDQIGGKTKYTKECMEAFRHSRSSSDLPSHCQSQFFPKRSGSGA